MQSKFFNPALNGAIFDGPVRIYFAQFHESLALKIYFAIQQSMASHLQKAKEISKQANANILVMVYPTEESFLFAFENERHTPAVLQVEAWQNHVVIGLRGPLEDEHMETLLDALKLSIDEWKPYAQVKERQFGADCY